MFKKAKILLTGASGNTGRVIAEELCRRGMPFLAMTHSDARLAGFKQQGFEAILGDFDVPETLELALTGIERAYLVCTPDEKLVRRESAFIAAAQKTGVRHIVLCSAYLADENAKGQNLRSHGIIEKTLRGSGIPYTIIRPGAFMQTFTLFVWDMLRKAGAISLPCGDGGMAMVDARDVARVAVKALTEPGHEGKVYDLTGPESLNMFQQAEILERILQKPVTYIPASEDGFIRGMAFLGVPEHPSEHIIRICSLQREHHLEMVLPTLRELGIRPTYYEQFLQDYLAGRTSGGNSFQPPDTFLIHVFNAIGVLLMRIRVSQARRSHHSETARRRKALS